MNKKNYLYILMVLLISYIITSYLNMDLADVISPIHNFFAGFLILWMAKDIKTFKVSWVALALTIIIWAITDLHWAYYVFFTDLDPNEITYFMYLYLLPNLTLLGAAIFYFVKNIQKWDKLQLLVDTLLITLIVMGVGSALYFSKVSFSNFDFAEFVSLFLYAFTDCITLSIILVMIASARYSKISRSIKVLTLGYLIYIITDLVYIDSYLNNTYFPNSITDILFLMSFVFFAVAANLTAVDQYDYLEGYDKDVPSNYGKSKVFWWVLIASILLFAFGKVSVGHLAVFLAIALIYLLFSHYIQKTMIASMLYDQEKKMKENLEQIIEKRTHELMVSKETLERRAITDSLTGLYNRDYYIESVNKKIDEGKAFSIISLDLNRFKVINDLYGHNMGDAIIKKVANRLEKNIHIASDICRSGGDVFSIISHVCDEESLEVFSKNLIEIIGVSIIVREYQFTVDACVGIARYPNDGLDGVSLVRSADVAMHQAKLQLTEHKTVIYSSNLIERLERRNSIEMLLNNASYDQEFELYYQPQFDAETKEIYGMEALLRWRHPEEGFISPAEFIPIAEETGQILSISDWVFKNAMIQIRDWNFNYQKNLIMGINLSPISVSVVGFFANLREMIEDVGVSPSMLDFEITEHSAMNTSSIMEELFAALSGLGVNVSIDDFGTGYSSLNYIKRFDVDTLKIAKELIDNIEDAYDDQLIVKAIIMMAKGMGLKTIAEGVETEKQFNILKEMGCKAIQGYYLGRPVDAQTFETNYLHSKAML